MRRKLTHEEFLNKFYKQNKHAQDIELMGDYINNRTRIKVKCKIDGHEWEAFPSNLLQGRGCPKCARKRHTLTHEEFIEKFYKQNKHANDIEILGTYVNTDTKILCKCRKCGHKWTPTPNSLLQGRGCLKCGNNVQTKTHEQFMVDFHNQNKHAQNIEILGTYVNSYTKIKCKCKIDGHEWATRPNSLLHGYGCPKCAKKAQIKTYEQFITELYRINPNIEVDGPYINNQTKIKCKCKICGHEWEAAPHNLLRGSGCPKCAGKEKTTEEFIAQLHQVSPDIEVVGTYIDTQTKVLCKCKIDDYEWEATPNNLLRGSGCPECGKKSATHKNTKTQEQFIIELYEVNPNIEVLEPYKTRRTKIKCKCRKCEYEWEAWTGNLLSGQGCPKCSTSKGERRIAQYLDNLCMDYIYNIGYFNDLVGIGGGLLRPDFIIPSLKIWIEYDGIQHFKPIDFTGAMNREQIQAHFKKVQQHDQIKNQYAKDNNWTLIRIPFTEYDNIEQILNDYLDKKVLEVG